VSGVDAHCNPPPDIGDCAQGATAAAIANAVYDALGVRVRSLPLAPEQLIAAMDYAAYLSCGKPRLRLMVSAAVRTADATRAGCMRPAGPVTERLATPWWPSRPT
jgi:hypothetical protein